MPFKIFSTERPNPLLVLENEMNQWLTENSGVEVRIVQPVAPVVHGGGAVSHAVIVYYLDASISYK